MEFEVRGDVAGLRAIAKQLKAVDDKTLTREFRKGIQRAARPLQTKVKAGVPQYLPSGYAQTLQKALALRTGVLQSGVRITATGKGKRRPREVARMDAGVLRHPVFGRYRDPWVNQRVKPGFFRDPLRAGAPDVRKAIADVLDRVAAKIAAGG